MNTKKVYNHISARAVESGASVCEPQTGTMLNELKRIIMENITIYDLIRGLDVNVKPTIYEDEFYFHVKVKNAPYFMMCQYDDDKDYDKQTLLGVSSYNHIDEKTAKDFEKFFNSLMPKFVGWNKTKVHYDTIKYDDNGILRVDFDLIWCEIG